MKYCDASLPIRQQEGAQNKLSRIPNIDILQIEHGFYVPRFIQTEAFISKEKI